ncbi:MAG TPA: hypothetical protein VHO47_01350 [Candidatus Babeliales bacterium]|nr:hypothetical protein [Candidatus Babeliales bacterium]
MKQVLITLEIDENKFIEIYFPDMENKFNYYYEPTERFHRFDEITIDYRNGGSINLYHDVLDDGPNALYLTLQSVQQKTCELPCWIEIGDLVRCLNESHEDGAEQKYKDIDFSNFWLWSTAGGAQSFVYTRNGKIYLEIGYIYKWHSRERKDSDTDFISYEEFAKNYKPILIQEITDETAQEWSAQCETWLKEVGWLD